MSELGSSIPGGKVGPHHRELVSVRRFADLVGRKACIVEYSALALTGYNAIARPAPNTAHGGTWGVFAAGVRSLLFSHHYTCLLRAADPHADSQAYGKPSEHPVLRPMSARSG